MNEMQKRSWAMVILIPLFFVMATISFLSMSDDFEKRIIGYEVILLGIAVVAGLVPVVFEKYLPGFFRRIQEGFEIAEGGFGFWKRVGFDERDRIIKYKASLGGYLATYLFYGGVCAIAFFVNGPGSSIRVSVLPVIFVGGVLIQILVRSLAVLIQYGWGGKKK